MGLAFAIVSDMSEIVQTFRSVNLVKLGKIASNSPKLFPATVSCPTIHHLHVENKYVCELGT